MADETPDPHALIKLARQTLSSAERRRKFRQIDFLDTSYWYPTQLKFFAAGSSGAHQRLLFSGNQSGKSRACSFEVATHMSGQYPEWWTGKRFNKPIRCWVVGESVILVPIPVRSIYAAETILARAYCRWKALPRSRSWWPAACRRWIRSSSPT
jgi:hypothetical protein